MTVAVQEIDGFDSLQRIFKDIADQLTHADYRETLDAMVGSLEETHQQYFDKRESPQGQRWKEWFFSSLDIEEHPTLEASGRLRASLRTGGADNIHIADQRSLEWGTAVDYAATHNFGARITSAVWLISRDRRILLRPGTTLDIPQREFMGMNEKTVQLLVDMAADAAVEFMKPE